MLALSLVAGFVAKENASCHAKNSTSKVYNLSVAVHYPFSSAQITLENPGFDPILTIPEISEKGFMQSAQFFVTWGSFTLFYGVIAIVVYMVTTANERIEWVVNFLVLTVSQKAVLRTFLMA